MTEISRRTAGAQILGAGLLSFAGAVSAAAEPVSYTYDELGRLKTATYGNGQIITYTYDAAGNRTALAQSAAGVAPTGTFSATPATISPGASSTLSWTSANAANAVINNGVGAATPVAGGSVSVSPTTTTTYTLTLTGAGGTAARLVTLMVS